MQIKLTFLLAGSLCLGATLSTTWAAAPATPQGVITAKVFFNIGGGTAVSDLTNNVKFPNSPNEILYEPYFELWATGDINTPAPSSNFDAYGDQIVGYFYPQTSGDYTFYISADDNAALYLSTDDNPANKKLIAVETAWSNPREYTTSGGSSTLESKRSDQFTGTEWPSKNKITLQAGKPYYIEALHKEGGGGDNVSVSIDGTLPIPGNMLSSFDKTSGPASITTQPQSATVGENQAVNLSVVANGTPPYTYQWARNGTDVAGATNATLNISRVAASQNGAQYTVKVTGAQGSVTSSAATLTVTPDKTAPTIVSARGSEDFQHATVTFSEPVDPTTGGNAANYSINGLTVSAAKVNAATNDNTVVLTTSKQAEGQTYTVTINNVKDISAAGNAVAANSTTTLKSLVFGTGWVTHKFWNNVTGGISGLTNDTRFPDSPDFTTIEPRWEYPPNGGNEAGDNYGNQLSGYFVPPKTGNYVFFTCSDDPSNLYLSTDDNPANKKLIAQESGWSNPRNWLAVGGGSTLEDKRSDTFSGTEWPGGNTINLTAGKRYYLESQHTEGGGGDNVSATFISAGDTDPANGTPPALTGSVVGTYLDPTGAAVNITTQPANLQVQEGRAGTLTFAASGSSAYGTNVTFQWQVAPKGSSTFTNVNGNTSSFITPVLALTDAGLQYRVIASVPSLSVTSAVASVTVVPDTFPPVLTNAGAIMTGTNFSGTVEIGLGFDEPLDATSAGTAGNYSLSKGTVTKVRVEPYDTPLDAAAPVSTAGAVVLETSGLAKGDTVTVTVKNVKDLKGNAIPAAGVTKTATVSGKMSWTQVGDNDFMNGTSGVTAFNKTPANYYSDMIPLGNDTDFDLISGGSQNWNNYDEATYVFEQVTGDFDRVAKVEYQDPSSQWARAGIMARKTLDAGVTRAQSEGGYSFSQAMIVRVNPVVQWNGAAGNNAYEWVWRDTDGGNYSSSGGTSPAPYPNAWLRLQRTGQTFNGFASTDGVKWNNIGSHTFPSDTPLPNQLYVGPYFGPELINNDAWSIGHSVVAKFRNYGPFSATGGGGGGGGGGGTGGGPTLSASRTANGITLTFTGTLQSADAITGPWTDMTGSSPQTVPTTGTAKFYRTKQ